MNGTVKRWNGAFFFDILDESVLMMLAGEINPPARLKGGGRFRGEAMSMEKIQELMNSIRGERYRIECMIGKGSMGAVFRAYDRNIDRLTAIKLIRRDEMYVKEEESTIQMRFKSEITSAGKLLHPNIVKIYDADTRQGVYFIIMEYIEGKTLKQVLKKQRTFHPRRALYLASQIVAGLHHAHERNVIHRDIKPANLMITSGNTIKITDFGIAKLTSMGSGEITAPGEVVGTPNYMSPERIRGESYDHRSDLFAAGCILYEMLTGVKPFGADNLNQIIKNVLYKEPAPPSEMNHIIPASWDGPLLKILAKVPEARYSKGAEFQAVLQNLIDTWDEEAVKTQPSLFEESPMDSEMKGPTETVQTGTADITAPQETTQPTDQISDPSTAVSEARKKLSEETSGAPSPFISRLPFLVLLLAVLAALAANVMLLNRLKPWNSWFHYASSADQARVFLLQAFEAQKNDRQETAVQLLDKALNADESLTAAHALKGYIHETANDMEAAKASYEKMLQLNAGPQEACFGLGRIAENRNDYQEAVRRFERASEWNSDKPAVLYKAALNAHRSGDVEKAEQLYLRLIEKYPDHPSAYNNLGVIYFQKGDAGKALQNFLKAESVGPLSPQALKNIATAHMELGDEVNETLYWRKLLEITESETALTRLSEIEGLPHPPAPSP